jgi:Chaperone of endosialidase
LFTAFASATLLFVSSAAAQNVGIGVSNPQSKLSVNGTTASGGLAIGDSTYTSTSGTVAPANGALIQGSVGVGILTPQVSLHVNGQVYVAGAGVTGQFFSGTANQDGVQINPGWIGVQRTTGHCINLGKPAGADGNLEVFFVAGTSVGQITTNGTSTTYGTTSDERLKENIRPSAKGLNEVMKIRASDYNFKSKPGKSETGFIAQPLYTVLPDVVNPGGENPAKNPWTVDYGRVTPLLTKAIQDVDGIVKEQQGEIDVLKKRLKALEAENAKLTAIVSKVESLEQAVNGLRTKSASQSVVLNK